MDGIVMPHSRWDRGAWIFRDETLRSLEILLDEAFRIPFTGIRFGIDGIIGLVPGLGDVLAGLLSLIIPLAAWVRGVPYITLVRMAANLGIGVLVGTIPILGDAFDIAWKPNRRNYRLLQRHLGEIEHLVRAEAPGAARLAGDESVGDHADPVGGQAARSREAPRLAGLTADQDHRLLRRLQRPGGCVDLGCIGCGAGRGRQHLALARRWRPGAVGGQDQAGRAARGAETRAYRLGR